MRDIDFSEYSCTKLKIHSDIFKDSHLDSKFQYESDNVTLKWENFLDKKEVKNRNNTMEGCVLISTQRGEWSIADCNEKKSFICEAKGKCKIISSES